MDVVKWVGVILILSLLGALTLPTAKALCRQTQDGSECDPIEPSCPGPKCNQPSTCYDVAGQFCIRGTPANAVMRDGTCMTDELQRCFSCNNGYQFDASTRSCVRLNTCLDVPNQFCSTAAVPVGSSGGSGTCVSGNCYTCISGYSYSQDLGKCVPNAQPCTGICLSNTANTAPASGTCADASDSCRTCNSGYSYNALTDACEIPNTCLNIVGQFCSTNSPGAGGQGGSGTCVNGDCYRCRPGFTYNPSTSVCDPNNCPRYEPGNPFVCIDPTGKQWQTFEVTNDAAMVVKLICDFPSHQPRGILFRQVAGWQTADFPIVVGNGQQGGESDVISNPPNHIQVRDEANNIVAQDANRFGCNLQTGAGCGYMGASGDFKIDNVVGTYGTGAIENAKRYSFLAWYNTYHMFRTDNPTIVSQFKITGFDQDGPAKVHFRTKDNYCNHPEGPDCAQARDDIYVCCGTWKGWIGLNGGTDWSAAEPTGETGESAKLCEPGYASCFAGGKFITNGVMGDGRGGYTGVYNTKSWLCARPAVSEYAWPAFYKCDASHANQTFSRKGGQQNCCQLQPNGKYEFTSSACSAATNKIRWGGDADGTGPLGLGSNWNSIDESQTTSVACTNPNGECNTGTAPCLAAGALQDSTTLCAASSGYFAASGNRIAARYTCNANNAGQPFRDSAGTIIKYCCQTGTNTYQFQDSCNSNQEYVGDTLPGYSTTGLDWNSKISLGPAMFSPCTTATSCATNTTCYAPGPIASSGNAVGCFDTGLGPARYRCSAVVPQLKGHVLTTTSGTKYCCTNAGAFDAAGCAHPDCAASCSTGARDYGGQLPTVAIYGTDWSTKVSVGPKTTCSAVQCEQSDGSCVNYNSNTGGAAPDSTWTCRDTGKGFAMYLCSAAIPEHVNHVMQTTGGNLCCNTAGQLVAPTAACCATDGYCNTLCAAGTDNDCVSPPATGQCVDASTCPAGGECRFPICLNAGTPTSRCSLGSLPAGTPCSSGACYSGQCMQCDADGDLHSPSTASPLCPFPKDDCRDNNRDVYTGRAEDVPTNKCTDGYDNSCQTPVKEADYDGSTNDTVTVNEGSRLHGDAACPVGVLTLTPTPATLNTYAACSRNVTFSCTTTQPYIRSVDVTLPGSQCGFVEWQGSKAIFTCTPPATDGTHTATCAINTAISYAIPAQQTTTSSFTVDCHRTLTGVVKDAKTGAKIVGALVTVNGTTQTATTIFDGSYTFTDASNSVTVGPHTVIANYTGYYAEERSDFIVQNEPSRLDLNLSPEECTSACTFKGVCDYRCIGQNGCTLSVAAADQEQFKSVCADARNGTQRDFNSTHIANCCAGTLSKKTVYQTPLELQSCAKQLIPHTRLVNYNGKLYQLTIMSYAECKK